MKEKTHWLQNPNKNYLGHWDLPEKNDLILTIKSAKWEAVKNPITGVTAEKRIVHFEEKYKPLICNQTNAKSILASSGVRYMEDAKGVKISLYIAKYFDRKEKEEIDAVRIRGEKVQGLPELKPNTKNWDNVKKALLNGYTLDQIKGKYTISEHNINKLQDETI